MSETSAAQPPSQSATSFGGAPTAELLKTITKLQSDGLLLLDHLTKRPTRQFVPSDTPVQADNTAKKDTDGPNDTNKSDKDTDGPNDTNKSDKDQSVRAQASDLNLSLEPLRWAPDEVAKNSKMFPALVRVVDALARLAYPATPESIKRSRKKSTFSGFLLLSFVLIGLGSALLMSSKIIEGRNLVVDSRAVQALARESYKNLFRLSGENFQIIECDKNRNPPGPECQSKASISASAQEAPASGQAVPASAQEVADAYPYCEPEPTNNEKPYFYRQAKSTDAKQLCSQLGEQKLRERMIFARLQGWNCEMVKLPLLPDGFLRLGLDLKTVVRGEFHNKLHYTECTDWFMSNEDLLRHWQRSELRATPTLQLLSQHLLPGAMAMLGAAIAMLLSQNRARLDGRLRDDSLSTIAMVIMPTSLGALIGLVWGSGPDIITTNQIKLGDFSLSLGVIAFFMGFVFEDVLNWLRRALLAGLESNAFVRLNTK